MIAPRGLARVLRVLGYTGIAVSGVVLAYALPLGTATTLAYVLLSAWMGLGGIICALGSLSDRWVGEFTGLPLLASAMLAFGGVVLRDTGWTALGVANFSLLAGLGLLFAARWRDVAAVYRSAAKAAKARRTVA